MNVLLIEDNALCAELTQDLLTKWEAGVRCTPVVSQAEALAHLAQQRFDLIVLDLTLVDTRGLMTVVPILQAAQPQGTPVLIYTGAEPDLAPKVIERGAAAFVGKNAPVDVLHAVLRELVGGRAPSSGSPGIQ